MRKILTFVLLGALVLSTIGAVAISEEDSDFENIIVSFSNPTMMEKNDKLIIDIQETDSYLMKTGYPMLPSYTKTLVYPVGTDIKNVFCEPLNIVEEELNKEIKISPVAFLVSKTSVNTETTDVDLENVYPEAWYDYTISSGLFEGRRSVIVNVVIYPVRYNSEQNSILYTNEVEINIDYEEKMIAKTTNMVEYDFLIITADNYMVELSSLVSHKTSRNIRTKLVTLSDVYNSVYFPVEGRDNAEKVKYFIYNAVENWGKDSLTNVMVVGDESSFPARSTHVKAAQGDSEVFKSDLYYGDLYNADGSFATWDTNENDLFAEFDWGSSHAEDEMDFYPDVMVGRLPVVSDIQVETIVEKIITYETQTAYTQNWFTNLVVVGGDSFIDEDHDPEGVLEGEHANEAVVNAMDGFIPTKLWVSNGVLSKFSPTGVSAIKSAIKDGCGFIYMSGHGNEATWATHPHLNDNMWLPTPGGGFFSNDINSLNNGDMQPVVVTGACSVSKYNNHNNCFSYAWLANPNGGGIASFGATGLGWAYISDDVTQGLVEYMAIQTIKAYRTYGAITVGEMWRDALTKYIGRFIDSSPSGTDVKTVLEWQLMGDPTLSISEESAEPVKPDAPEGPTKNSIDTPHEYKASTTDPDGDKLYYLFDWGDGTYSEWVGPYNSGLTAKATHTWTSQGTFSIKVKAKDQHGVQSDWSSPLSVQMPKSKSTESHIMQKLMDMFPNLFELIRQILLV